MGVNLASWRVGARRLALALAALLAAAAAARAVPVDLELVLAVDVSRSVDDEEARLQREGYASAFLTRQVIGAIRSGSNRAIAVTYVEWAGTGYQNVVVPWTLIDGEDSAENFVSRILAAPRIAASWTSVSGAIDFSAPLFDDNGFEGIRRVIDVSGDGRNNQGRPAEDARDDAVRRGIVINGLPILNDRTNFGRPPEADLGAYYAANVIGGPGSFLIAAEDFHSFAQAIFNKLIREIAGELPPDGPQLAQTSAIP